ncbi:MAG: hypothetical protein OIF51_01270 [Cellvibrionaceae bacterium]|nr:hypothetical protein [Cellvibrionaceae bacterium]
MGILKGKLNITFLCIFLLVGVFLLWQKGSVNSNTSVETGQGADSSRNVIAVDKRKHQLSKANQNHSPTQRITKSKETPDVSFPAKPKIITMADLATWDEVQQLAVVWPGMKESIREFARSYRFEGSDSKEEVKAVIDLVLEDSAKAKAAALQELRHIIYWCDDGHAGHIDCNQVHKWISKQEEGGKKYSVFEQIEKLATAGDLYAQFIYPHNLHYAARSGEVNTARDIQLWMERRQRMIEYLVKFAKAGEVGAQFYLAATFEENHLIKANPFWSAVFYKQVKLHFGEYHPYENLVELHELDEALIEKARQEFFDN